MLRLHSPSRCLLWPLRRWWMLSSRMLFTSSRCVAAAGGFYAAALPPPVLVCHWSKPAAVGIDVHATHACLSPAQLHLPHSPAQHPISSCALHLAQHTAHCSVFAQPLLSLPPHPLCNHPQPVAPQYYTAPPAMPPSYPAAAYGPPPTAAPAAGVPWWVWMGAGIVVAKLADFVSGPGLWFSLGGGSERGCGRLSLQFSSSSKQQQQQQPVSHAPLYRSRATHDRSRTLSRRVPSR